MKPLVLVVVVFLAVASNPEGAHGQSLEAEIFSIKSLTQAQEGNRKAVVQGANVDALVDEIFKAIKPQEPSLQPLELSLGVQTLARFREALVAKQAACEFVELKVQASVAGTAGTPGKAGRPRANVERLPTTAEQMEPGKLYEVQISRTGYTPQKAEFAVQRQAGTLQLEFGDERIALEPATANSLGFLVDTTALSEGSRASLRETIGKTLDLRHHVFRFFPNASLAEVAQVASRRSSPFAQGPPPQPPFPGLTYVIKVTRSNL